MAEGTNAAAPEWWLEPSRELIALARELGAVHKQNVSFTDDRVGATLLSLALFAIVREEWEAAAKAAGWETELEYARHLMAAHGYGPDKFPLEPVCGPLGQKPPICVIDGKEAVAYDHALYGLTPLSAIYTNKVREAMDIAAEVDALVERVAAEGQAGEPKRSAQLGTGIGGADRGSAGPDAAS